MLVLFGYIPIVLLSGQDIAANINTERTDFKFDFGPGKTALGYIQIMPNTVYSREIGYGFESGAQITAKDRNGER